MKLKQWIRIIIFVLLAGALIWAAAIFLSVPEARDVTGMYGFYKEKKDSLDIILVGPSTMYTDFYSPLAYEEERFTSYAISTGGLSGAMYKYAVNEALERQNPDVFVVDMSGFCEGNQRDSAAMRRFADSIRKGSNRSTFIAEMIPKEEQESYRIPFLKYHSGWERVRGCFKTLKDKLEMNRRGYSITKNFCAYADTATDKVKQGTYELSEAGMESLKEFLTFLKEKGIGNVLFVRCPNRNLSAKGNRLMQAVTLVENAGFDYLDATEVLMQKIEEGQNFTDVEKNGQLNLNKDFYDADHLNIYGAEKFTKYLCKELAARYSIHTKHDVDVTEQWDACAAQNENVLAKTKRMTDEHYHEGLYTQSDFLN